MSKIKFSLLRNCTAYACSAFLAVLMFIGVVHAQSGQAEAHYQKALVAQQAGKTLHVEKYLVLAHRADPAHAEASLQLVELYLGQQRLDDGVNTARKTLEVVPGNARMWSLLGQLLRDKGNTNGAKIAYEQSIAYAPDDPVVLSAAASFFSSIGESERSDMLAAKRQRLLSE